MMFVLYSINTGVTSYLRYGIINVVSVIFARVKVFNMKGCMSSFGGVSKIKCD
jgi:hypothetical protein